MRTADGKATIQVYVNRAANFADYDKLLLEPVTIWTAEQTSSTWPPEQELANLADIFFTRLYERLSKSYTLVREPQPGTLRLRVAITEANGALIVVGDNERARPAEHSIEAKAELAASTRRFAREAAFEFELLDATTGKRLVAGVDSRAGSRSLSRWRVNWWQIWQLYDGWAERVQSALVRLQQAGPLSADSPRPH